MFLLLTCVRINDDDDDEVTALIAASVLIPVGGHRFCPKKNGKIIFFNRRKFLKLSARSLLAEMQFWQTFLPDGDFQILEENHLILTPRNGRRIGTCMRSVEWFHFH